MVQNPGRGPVTSGFLRAAGKWWHRVGWGGPLLLYLVAGLTHLDSYIWDYDEGVVLQSAALSQHGYTLYTDIAFNKPPLIIWWLRLAFAVGGTNRLSAQLAILLLTATGLLLLGVIARLWWGKGAGPATMVLFLLLPETAVRATVVMNDLPAMTCVLAATATATQFRRDRQWWWLSLSGVLWGIALGFHPLLIYTGLPIALILFCPQQYETVQFRRLARHALLFGGGVFIAILPWLILEDWESYFFWVYTYNRAPLGPELAERASRNLATLLQNLGEHWFVLVQALFASIVLFLQPRRRFWVAIAGLWFFLTLLVLRTLRPLWPHYTIFALYPLLLLGGGGVSWAVKQLRADRQQTQRWATTVLGVGLFVVSLVYGVRIPRDWPVWPSDSSPTWGELAKEIPAESLVISDNPFMAFVSERLVAPWIVDTSSKRVSTGFLTVADIVTAQQYYGIEHLVFERNGYFSLLAPAIYQWAEEQAIAKVTVGRFTRYRFEALPSPAVPLTATLLPGIHLRGFALSPLSNSGELKITLFWENKIALTEDYKLFVHLLDESGNLVGQYDGFPASGWGATSSWRPGVLIPENVSLSFDGALPSGKYQIAAGMYTWPEVTRLQALQANGEPFVNNIVPVTSVTLKK